MTETSHAVFLSYASQDAEAAQKICEALRAAGIEVFLDQSELRGGDAWDQKIRHEIHDCALFIPIVSEHTQERLEGYFRHEWKLAIERTHCMAEQKAFLVPVVVDSTGEREAVVPDAFRAVQWTRLPGGDTRPAFVERIKRLLSPELSSVSAASGAAPALRRPVRATWQSKPILLGLAAVFMALAYFVADKLWITKHLTPASAAFNPPPHSIAVLPFVNLSGDKEQEYFSDGLTEELLNALAEIDGLQVAARTSSFSFKEHPDIATVAHRLNVGAVLEGSVRRSANTVRVTAQLINGVTGFHVWSRTYDRDLGDVLRLQTEIATAVANTLKVTLLGDIAAKIELGGTRSAAALDAYLRGVKARRAGGPEKLLSAIAAFSEAIGVDPHYALAFAARSHALAAYTADSAVGVAIHEGFDKAQADARQAIALAPELAEGHLALGHFLELGSLDFAQAREAYQRALELGPGNAGVLDSYARFAAYMGRPDAAIAAAQHAISLDPLNPSIRRHLGYVLTAARRYGEAIAAHREALTLNPDSATDQAFLGLAYYLLGDLQNAQSSCQIESNQWVLYCLAVTYHKLGRQADAEAALAKFMTSAGEYGAYQYATIYAQWSNIPKALEYLDKAVRARDSGLEYLKTDPLMDPLRKEPRFQAIEQALKFPN